MDALGQIYADVDRLLLAEDVPREDRARVQAVATRVVGDHMTKAASGAVPRLAHPDRTVAEIVSDVCDFGVLGELFDQPEVEDILVEGAMIRSIVGGRPQAPCKPTTELRNLHVVTQLLLESGAALNDSHPLVDGVQVLAGRGRLAASIPPVTPALSATIRLKRGASRSLDELVADGMLTEAAAEFLVLLVQAQRNFIVSGETGSGKTTLLSAVLPRRNPAHVLRIIEEYREIDIDHDLGSSSQVAPKAEQAEARTIAGLLRHILRKRPDVLVVGEVRGPETWGLARAAAVGAGFATTVHAPHASGALEALVLLSRGHEDRPEPVVIRETFSDRIAAVIHCERGHTTDGDYVHRVTEIRVVQPPVDPTRLFTSEPLFTRDGLDAPLVYTGTLPPPELVVRLEAHLPRGQSLRNLLGTS